MPFYFSKLSVLVAEDVDPMRKLILAVLQSLDIESANITTTKNGRDAFSYFCRDNHDIVLTDWDMPSYSGIDLTQRIRREATSPNRLVPIIFLTGYSAVKRVTKARDAGATEYLVKPFTGADLAKRIAYVINKPRDFIDAPDYFGPDRRRRDKEGYSGPFRRADDAEKFLIAVE